ncbi:MAG: hypothetical protein EXQ48_07675 [Acidobacteria bacterium]|nr:hypothetical protein [Acidobacteriota bacterium]
MKATAIALAVAILVLMTTVLPAEYGIDPLGTGKALGLSAIAGPSGPTVIPKTAAAGGPITPRSAGYKVDAIELTLIPGDTVEYKYHLDAGAPMLYTWKASVPIEFDLHTEPDQGGAAASDSFEAGTKSEGHGSYIAPYAGIHGWYWKNTNPTETVKITLQTAGFYSVAKMFAGSPEPTEMEVQDPPPPPTY